MEVVESSAIIINMHIIGTFYADNVNTIHYFLLVQHTHQSDDYASSHRYTKAKNNIHPLAVFQPISAFNTIKFGRIVTVHTFPIESQQLVYNNVSTFDKWLFNF